MKPKSKPSEPQVPQNNRKTINRKIPAKIFKSRNSILTELLEGGNFRSFYNMVLIIIILTIFNSILNDYTMEKRSYFGMKLMQIAFSRFDLALIIWICMFTTCMSTYFVFLFWAHIRKLIKYKSLWDLIFILLLLLFTLGFSYIVSKMVLTNKLGTGSSLAIMLEMTRMLMKVYAFVRTSCTNFIEVDSYKSYPKFSHYLYFLFCPTLLYRDNYPRLNGGIRWSFIFIHLAEIVVIIIFFNIIIENTLIYQLKDYGVKEYTIIDILTVITKNTIFICGYVLMFFYGGFHCYLNITSELLKFADRMFYEDWWTAETYDEFLRRWNVFVHDWLHTYIYKDCYEYLFVKNRNLSRLVTFMVAAIYHDLIMSISVNFFIPLMTCEYIAIFLFRKIIYGNKLILFISTIGTSYMFTLYAMEYYARANCPTETESVWDYIKPRYLNCLKGCKAIN